MDWFTKRRRSERLSALGMVVVVFVGLWVCVALASLLASVR